ncbi:unnamed protein product [Mytilus edulis]|uniref:DDE Tnp4 domain-containing protein n=1 Tax=Mytilus edulis TaxID=6550 RepID=A0A8S3TIS7_MYTED|nr:unnamed protein product [Mytilus edulis]
MILKFFVEPCVYQRKLYVLIAPRQGGIDGLCMVLRRLAYPCRLEDLEYIFGRSKTELSLIINEVLDYIHDNHCHLLSDFNMSWLSQESLERFADAVFDRDGPLDSCWGFIDGTVRPICRPQENQRLVFNGHKRSHALKFQSIVTPNGIISNLFGPLEGRRHDAGMLRESDILTQMRVHMTSPEGRIFCIYGDPAYPVTDGYIIAPFRGGVISRNQMIFNKRMSACEDIRGDPDKLESPTAGMICRFVFPRLEALQGVARTNPSNLP